MITKDHLEIAANITAILTFFGGAGAWCYYQYGRRQKRRKLETHLKDDGKSYKAKNEPGAFNFKYIITETGMTESEIIQASFRSKRINRIHVRDAAGYTIDTLFQYRD